MIKPRTPAPPLEVALVGGGRWSLSEQQPERFTLVVSYRGYHCPVCRGYLKRLDRLAEVGVTSVIAVSGDEEHRATQTVEEWGLERLPGGYGQPILSMREWGLFISKGIKEENPNSSANQASSWFAPTAPSTQPSSIRCPLDARTSAKSLGPSATSTKPSTPPGAKPERPEPRKRTPIFGTLEQKRRRISRFPDDRGPSGASRS